MKRPTDKQRLDWIQNLNVPYPVEAPGDRNNPSGNWRVWATLAFFKEGKTLRNAIDAAMTPPTNSNDKGAGR